MPTARHLRHGRTRRRRYGHRGGRGGATSYSGKVLSTEERNLIGYWPLWEASGSVAKDISWNGRDGTHVGVTLGQSGIGDDRTSPYYDGANDYTNIYSASLAAAFNGAEGTLVIWAKVANVGVWTDATSRYLFSVYAGDGNNAVFIRKDNGNNLTRFHYKAGAVEEEVNIATNSIDWVQYGITWSATADEVKLYMAGAQVGTTQTGLGTWVGTLTSAAIGAYIASASGVYYGWLAHSPIWTKALTPAQIAYLWAVR